MTALERQGDPERMPGERKTSQELTLGIGMLRVFPPALARKKRKLKAEGLFPSGLNSEEHLNRGFSSTELSVVTPTQLCVVNTREFSSLSQRYKLLWLPTRTQGPHYEVTCPKCMQSNASTAYR